MPDIENMTREQLDDLLTDFLATVDEQPVTPQLIKEYAAKRARILALMDLGLKAQRIREALEKSHAALVEMAEWHGGTHEDDCPVDDTCDCKHKAFNQRINAACNAGEVSLQPEPGELQRSTSEGN